MKESFFDVYVNMAMRVLIIGSDSHIFVDKYREKCIDAFGCDSTEHPFVYNKPLEDVNFPTDYFDVVIVRKYSMSILKEVFRILKQIDKNGLCILDLPNKISSNTIEDAGFVIECPSTHLRKPIQIRKSILLPPGIGDIYWTLVKMQSLLKWENIGIPNVSTVCNIDKNNGHMRGHQFIEMFPFLNATWENIENDPKNQVLYNEAYGRAGQTIFSNYPGYDYFMSYNGNIDKGVSLEKIDTDLECNWFPPMFISKNQDRFKRNAKWLYGNYVIFHFMFYGTFSYWLKEFSVSQVIDYIKKISNKLDLIPILVAGGWNSDEVGIIEILEHTSCVDMIGKTSTEELFGLIRGAKMVIGFPSGLTMLAPVLGTKTLTIWNNYYPEATSYNVVPPSLVNKKYFVTNTKQLTVDSLIDRTMQIW